MNKNNHKLKSKEWIKHIIKEDSRKHVIWWDMRGSHCKCPNCEINKNYNDLEVL